MAEESVQLAADENIEYHIVTLFEKIENLRAENVNTTSAIKTPLRVEIRTLELWRSVISECIASFIYVLVVSGAAEGAGAGATLIATALAAGFAMTSLTQCFGYISGAHVNPAVSIAMGITKKISLLRSSMFVVGQLGGSTAGAAFLYGVVIPRYERTASVAFPSPSVWDRFGVEFVAGFVVVFVYFVCMTTYRKYLNSSCITVGTTYSTCTFMSMPYMNPARSLGRALVLSRWEHHWVYWMGPISGGVVAGLTYEFIFNPRRQKRGKESTDGDSSSVHSDEDTYDDLDKPAPKFHGSTYNTYRPAPNTAGYCASLTSASLYSAPPAKLERVESLYGGTKSLYCKSPPLTRANLNRSQSVYTKSNSGVNRDVIPKPGPLVPAQSLYPMRLNQQSHVQNQNLQNQLQQRSESIYGVRDRYENRTYRNEENQKSGRPESMYGMVSRRGQSAQSDDSSYGSYQGPPRSGGYQKTGNYPSRGGDARVSPPTQIHGQGNYQQESGTQY